MSYYKMRMLDNNSNTYHAYVSAYDKSEARKAIRYELLDDEKEDVVDGIEEITEEEYVIGIKEYGNGVRI